MDTTDAFYAPFYLLIILIFFQFYRKKKYGHDPELLKHFTTGFFLRLLGAMSFAFIYQFYYNGGDTHCFFFWSRALSQSIFKDYDTAINYIFFNDQFAFSSIKYGDFGAAKSGGLFDCMYLFKYNSNEAFFIKIITILTMLGINTYLTTTFLFAIISFTGAWRLFLVFSDIFPNNRKEYALATLYVPSLYFWGSGILKDSITLAGMGFLTYSLYFGIIKRQNVLLNVISIIVISYIIGNIKGYILLAFFPGAIYWIFSTYKEKIKSNVLKTFAAPFMLLFSGIFIFITLSGIGDSLGRFSVSNLESTAKDYQAWHKVASADGSAYTLGEMGDYSMGALFSKIPLAINVTLFRPYIWEAKNIVMILASLESIFIMYLTLQAIFKLGLMSFFKIIRSDPTTIFCLFFSLFFAFSVGFTSYNFGALVRYKIPCIAFYIIAITNIRNNLSSVPKPEKILQEST